MRLAGTAWCVYEDALAEQEQEPEPCEACDGRGWLSPFYTGAREPIACTECADGERWANAEFGGE
jgi:hypothetical protein